MGPSGFKKKFGWPFASRGVKRAKNNDKSANAHAHRARAWDIVEVGLKTKMEAP